MNHLQKHFSAFILLLTILSQVTFPHSVLAAGTVGTGTALSCTEAALNAALGGGGSVDFNCGGGPVTIPVTSTKTISASTQINGDGLITISGGNSVQIFSVQTGAALSLTGLTLSNGNSGASQGGAITIANGATATITTSTISNNTSNFNSAAAGVAGGAGAIYNAGTLNIIRSTFSGNTAAGSGGDGGAIFSNGAVSITDSTFFGNSAATNGSGGTGGAIRIEGGSGSIKQSTFSNNANDAAWGTVDINNANATMVNSILANSVSGFDCSKRNGGTLTSTNNLIENNSGTGTCSPAVSTDPALGGLQNNGGPTQTMAIPTSSVAYNYTAICPSGIDQRGVSRPQPSGGNCDLGAYEIDTAQPTVTINQAGSQNDPTSSSPISFTVVFSEAVTGFTASDVILSGTAGATTVVISGSGPTYTVTVSGMTGDGTVVATIPANAVTDIAGNNNLAAISTDNTVTYDTTRPTVTINQAAGQPDPTSSSPINFTVVFSEPVSGFAASGITLSGTAGATNAVISGSGTTYTVAASGMTGTGTVIASVLAGAATDGAGNTNQASTSTDNTVTYDSAIPSVTINQAAGQADPTSSSPVNFTVVFSSPVTDFATGDITLSGTAGATTAVVSGSGTTYTVAVSGMTGDGTVIATIPANVAHNAAGTGNATSTSTDNQVTFIISGLTVTINQAVGQADPTSSSPINFTVVFSSAVTDFATGDVTLSGTAGATTATVTGSGTTYTVAVSGMTGPGTVIAKIAAGVAHNAVNTGNQASSSTDNTVTYDLGYPIVSNSTPTNRQTLYPGPTKLVIQYNKDVKNGGSAGAANNPANYLLVEIGVNKNFDTVSCAGGVVADDTRITVDSASYTNNGGTGPFTATLNINSGISLPVGSYRLFVCGTTSIEDLGGGKLNNGLSDTLVNFTVATRSSSSSSVLPKTGFPMNSLTLLPAQPANKAYTSTDLLLEISRLGVKMPIVGVPFTDGGWDVSWLDKGAGWLNGSAFPTWNGNSVLTGHVWDALNRPGPFAGLKDLKYGDQVKIHAFGQVFTYEVVESSLISPTDTSTVLAHKEKPWITLVTCETYKERTQEYLYRRMVRAVLVNVATEK